MKRASFAAAGAVIALLAVVASSACGGDSDEPPQIQSAHGDAVRAAVLAAADRAGPGYTDDERDGRDAPSGAIAPDALPEALALQQASTGITVTGYGVASTEADSALLELYFGGYDIPVPVPGMEGDAPGGISFRSASAISEPDLQPVIDALVDAGVAREDIELIGGTYYDIYSSSATLRVTVRDINRIDTLVQAATGAAVELQEIYLQGTYVSYTVEDCAALMQAALEEAAADGRERGAALAQALGLNLGAVIAAADYGWSPYGGTPCGTGYAGPYPVGGVAYAESQPRQVQVYSAISVTFAFD